MPCPPPPPPPGRVQPVGGELEHPARPGSCSCSAEGALPAVGEGAPHDSHPGGQRSCSARESYLQRRRYGGEGRGGHVQHVDCETEEVKL